MKLKLFILLLVSFFLFCLQESTSSFDASGYVIDSDTKLPISDADVNLSCNGSVSHTRSNSSGYFSIGIDIYDSANVAILTIQKDGYAMFSKEIIHIYFGGSADDNYYLKRL